MIFLRKTIVLLSLMLALGAVAAVPQASADAVACTMSMPPSCEADGVPTVWCTMSMPPECRTS